MFTRLLNLTALTINNNLEFMDAHWSDLVNLGIAIAQGNKHDAIQPIVNILLFLV